MGTSIGRVWYKVSGPGIGRSSRAEVELLGWTGRSLKAEVVSLGWMGSITGVFDVSISEGAIGRRGRSTDNEVLPLVLLNCWSNHVSASFLLNGLGHKQWEACRSRKKALGEECC